MTLLSIFSRLEDPRRGPAKRYGLNEIIVMAICAVLCGADDWVEVADWCEDEEAWLQGFLDLPHGTPSHDTFGDVFRVLDPDVFESCFREWIGGLLGVVKDIVALDGKTVRGSKDGAVPPLHLVSAYATSLGLTLGQEGSAGKGNELKAVRALLDTLLLDGCIVTLDALGCQTDIAAAIVGKGGDYVLAVKANQKTLSEALSESFETGEERGWGSVDVQYQTTVEKDHGRIETRRAVWVPRIDWLPEAILKAWPTLGAVGMIETTQEKGLGESATISTERRYFIMSRGVTTVGDFSRAVRAHWGIESMHWILDVTFREDACRVRKDAAARNLSLLRKITLAMLRLDTAYPKSSLRQRRNRASRKPLYRTELLGLRQRSKAPVGKPAA
jgi:predicted transposase YbfD/YdcC